jgi:hypothetical protein
MRSEIADPPLLSTPPVSYIWYLETGLATNMDPVMLYAQCAHKLKWNVCVYHWHKATW